MSTEEFCGGYKGTHRFEEGENQCRCGRAYLRAPRPDVAAGKVVRDHMYLTDQGWVPIEPMTLPAQTQEKPKSNVTHHPLCDSNAGGWYSCMGFPWCTENVKNEEHPCPTADCPGDARYPAPGRRHLETCNYPREAEVPSLDDVPDLPVCEFCRLVGGGHTSSCITQLPENPRRPGPPMHDSDCDLMAGDRCSCRG